MGAEATELEAPRRLESPGDTDAVTIAWADAPRGAFGFARLGRGLTPDGALSASALAVLFTDRRPAGALAEGGAPLHADAGWDAVAAGGVRTSVEAPLAAWTVAAAGELELALEVEATTPPALLEPEDAAARAGGMVGYEQLCRVRGTVGATRIDALGQRSRTWGNPDWDAIALTRTVGVWLPDGDGLVATAIRPVDAASHADEALWAALAGAEGAVPVPDARLSTTTDAGGRQRRAGFELPPASEAGRAHRIAGEVLAGSTLDLGALRLDCAFLQWHSEGRLGVGRYDVLRRAT